eukprot:m.46660 g.46660  ORF g.46660 m.46660 type:complete len:200 (+) comp12266_c0_seq1:494-1093(+)
MHRLSVRVWTATSSTWSSFRRQATRHRWATSPLCNGPRHLHTCGPTRYAEEEAAIPHSEEEDDLQPPEPPVYCCQSGCANCVWIEYALQLEEYERKMSERAQQPSKPPKPAVDASMDAFAKLEQSIAKKRQKQTPPDQQQRQQQEQEEPSLDSQPSPLLHHTTQKLHSHTSAWQRPQAVAAEAFLALERKLAEKKKHQR